MPVFEQESNFDFSDEALYGAAESEVIEEPVEEKQPEADISNEQVEATEPDISKEQVEGDEVVEEKPKETVDFEAKFAELEQKLKDANQGMTKGFQESSELRKQNEQYAQQVQKLTDQLAIAASVKPMNEDEKKEFIERFLSNPNAVVAEITAPLLQAQSQKMREEAQAEAVRREQSVNVLKAKEALSAEWPALNDAANNTQLADKLLELSRNATNGKDLGVWRNHPEMFLREAAISLWGLPQKLNQQALDEVQKKAEEAALARLKAAEQGKAKAAPAVTSKPPTQEMTEHEKIIEDMRRYHGGGVF